MNQFLSDKQLKQLFDKVSNQPFALRNYCMLSMMLIHGLRVQELLALKCTDLNLKEGTVWINRCNNGVSGLHLLTKQEGQLLSAWLKQRPHYTSAKQTALFVTRNGEQWTRFGVMKIINDLAQTLNFALNSMTFLYTCREMLEKLPAREEDIRIYLGRDNKPLPISVTYSLQRGFRRLDELTKRAVDYGLTSQNGPNCLLVWLLSKILQYLSISYPLKFVSHY